MKFPIRYSLRTVVYGLTLACIAIGLPCAILRYQGNRQRNIIARLEALGVGVSMQKEVKPSLWVAAARNWIDPDAFRKPNGVQFHETIPNLDEAVTLVCQLNDLREIMIDGATLNDEHFRNITKVESLTYLMATKGSCDSATADCLVQNKNWVMLQISEAKFNDGQLAEIAKMKSLTHLTFNASQASASGLQSLEGCTSLQDLYTYDPKHAGGIAKAVRKIPAIRAVILLNAQICADDLAEFGDIGALKWLQFYDCQIDSAKIDRLASAKSLTNIEFFLTPVSPAIIDAVRGYPRLTMLGLDSCVDDSNAEKLADLSALKMLALSNCNLTDEGLQQFAKIRTLKSLTLTEDTRCTEAGIRRLQEKAPVRVSVGVGAKGLQYLPGGGVIDKSQQGASMRKQTNKKPRD